MPVLARASLLRISDRQQEVLRSLIDLDGWARPMDVGGRDQSHHSRTLMQLVGLQLAETMKLHAIYCPFGTHYIHENGKIKRVRKPIKLCRCKGSRKFRVLP